MEDDIAHGIVTLDPEFRLQVVVKRQVDIDLAIGRAVEWPHGRGCRPTSTLNIVTKQYHGRRLVGSQVVFPEQRAPDIFGKSQINSSKLSHIVSRGIDLRGTVLLIRVGRVGIREDVSQESSQETAPKQEKDNQQNQTDSANATA